MTIIIIIIIFIFIIIVVISIISIIISIITIIIIIIIIIIQMVPFFSTPFATSQVRSLEGQWAFSSTWAPLVEILVVRLFQRLSSIQQDQDNTTIQHCLTTPPCSTTTLFYHTTRIQHHHTTPPCNTIITTTMHHQHTVLPYNTTMQHHHHHHHATPSPPPPCNTITTTTMQHHHHHHHHHHATPPPRQQYMAPSLCFFGPVTEAANAYNSYRLYGSLLLITMVTCVFIGVKFVSKLSPIALLCVLGSILAIYIGIFVANPSRGPKFVLLLVCVFLLFFVCALVLLFVCDCFFCSLSVRVLPAFCLCASLVFKSQNLWS